MKKTRNFIFAASLSLAFVFSNFVAPEEVSAGPNCGGPVGFTEIRTVQDFANIAQDPYGSYKLCNNLDFSNSGIFNLFFSGILDGQNYSISNFRTANHGSYEGLPHIGLFSIVQSATIKNLKLLNVDLNFDGAYNSFTGGLAGLIKADNNGENPSVIDNVEITGDIVKSGDFGVGLLAAQVEYSTIKNIKITGTVESNNVTVGGVAGIFHGSTLDGAEVDTIIRHESGTDPLTITGYVGGIFGQMEGSTLSDIVLETEIGHGSEVGGIVGYSFKTNTIRDSRAVVDLTPPNATYTGGLIGRTGEGTPYSVEITNTKVSGNVKGRQAGGLIGLALKPSIEKSAFGIGAVTADTRGGGLIGYVLQGPRIIDSYSKATIEKINASSPLAAGGLVGYFFGSASFPGEIENSYYAGIISPSPSMTEAGGIIGFYNNSDAVNIDHVYFDRDLSNFENGIGEGKTTQQMTTVQSTYVGWDFMNTWLFQTGQYPELRVLADENSCPADFDGDGTLGVPDIFAFLSAWFAQDPAADFDNNGIIAVPDIFAFLSAWFAGC